MNSPDMPLQGFLKLTRVKIHIQPQLPPPHGEERLDLLLIILFWLFKSIKVWIQKRQKQKLSHSSLQNKITFTYKDSFT